MAKSADFLCFPILLDQDKMETSNNSMEETTALLNHKTPLRILVATEYLPPFVSGISNRCKNLIKGYKERGHAVTVFSLNDTDCDYAVPSIPNPLYNAQRMFIFPPLWLLFSLLNPWATIPWDVVHLFGIDSIIPNPIQVRYVFRLFHCFLYSDYEV
jgi:hypothetical protein